MVGCCPVACSNACNSYEPRSHIATIDATAPAAVMEKMAAKIAGADFVALDGLGHFGWAEAPDRFNAALLGFLGRRGLLG